MKKITIGTSDLQASPIILGCMRIGEMSVNELERLVFTAIENGVNYFDHADIYWEGRSEELFGQLVSQHPDLREKIVIQTKCGIRSAFYDFSKEHILSSVDDSLRRLRTDFLDVLLLHRPDTLMEPDEVNEAFEILYKSGKVRHFGVSNQNSMQVELLKSKVQKPLIINQLQFSIMFAGLVDSGMNVNMTNPSSVMHDGSTLEYCRLKNMTIQAWSPFQFGHFEGVFLDNSRFSDLNNKINELAWIKKVSNTAIAAAWILRHPAHMQVITGTTNAQRLSDICKATEVELTREEWYAIYRAGGHTLP